MTIFVICVGSSLLSKATDVTVGSCSLHVVHGAFRTGMKQTGWGIDLLLKSLYSHLHETPAKREDYTKMTGSEVILSNFVDTDGLRTKE